MLPEQEKQPFLPRVGMVWFFVVVTLVAVAMGIVRSAEQGAAFAAALVFLAICLVLFALFSAGAFLVAFAFGATERAIASQPETPASPFVDGRLPEQIIPPTYQEER